MISNFIVMKKPEKNYRLIIREYIQETIHEKGYRNITLDELTDQLRISKKTFYKNYKDKEEIYKVVLKDELEDAYRNLVILLQAKSTMAEKISRLSTIIEKNIVLFNTSSLQKIKKEYYGLWKEIILFRKEMVFPLIDFLLDHSKKKDLIKDYPNEMIIELFSVGLNLAIEKTFNMSSIQNYRPQYNTIFEILLNGILTKKGKKLLAINKRMKNGNN